MRLFCILILLNTCLLAQNLDIDRDMVQSFVLETKKISIPGFPYAFNPSLIKCKGAYLMSFRAGKEYQYDEEFEPGERQDYFEDCSCNFHAASTYSPNRIGLIWLDLQFNPITRAQLLDIPNKNPTYRQQDPRLIEVGDKIFLVYSDMIKGLFTEQTRRMFVAELHFDGVQFFVKEVECLSDFENAQENRWEKNWVAFSYENELLLAYSINPHKILCPLLGTGVCTTVAQTAKKIDWQWGELRGGTPALLIPNGEEYLAFFHSSIVMESEQSRGTKLQHYFMGAYTFSAHPPFAIKRISTTPIVGKNFYSGPKHNTWKPLLVVFPGGFVLTGNSIYVAYGRQDHEIWVAKLDKKGLFNSLVPVAD